MTNSNKAFNLTKLQKNKIDNLNFDEKRSLIKEDLKDTLSDSKIKEEQLQIYSKLLKEIENPRSGTPWGERIENDAKKIDDKKLADEVYSKAALKAAGRGTGYEGGIAGGIFDGLEWAEKFIEKIDDKKLADEVYSKIILVALKQPSYSKETLEYYSKFFACKGDNKKLNDLLESLVKNGKSDYYYAKRLAVKLDNKKILNEIFDYKLKNGKIFDFDRYLAVKLDRKDVLLVILNSNIRSYISAGGSGWADKIIYLSQILGDKRSLDEMIFDYKKNEKNRE